MAAVREYFETDFSYVLRVYVRLPFDQYNLDFVILYDFSGYKVFSLATTQMPLTRFNIILTYFGLSPEKPHWRFRAKLFYPFRGNSREH